MNPYRKAKQRTVSDKLKRLLAETGATQSVIAERAGLYPEMVSRIINGKTPDPQWSTMVSLVRRGYGVSLAAVRPSPKREV